MSALRLNVRDRHPELMDQPGLDAEIHRQALRGLKRINTISGTSRVVFRRLIPLWSTIVGRAVRILDVATGGGDVITDIARLAYQRGLPFEIAGCDISSTAISCASTAARSAGFGDAKFFEHDILATDLPEEYDVVFCSLFLHHLSDEEAVIALGRMARAARHLLLVDDLRRTWLGYNLAWFGARVLSRSPIVHVDGPLSVRAALSMDEAIQIAKRSGLKHIQIAPHWPQRFLMTGTTSNENQT